MPSARAVVPGMTLPPAEVVYHRMFEPVTAMSEIVGFVPLQKAWAASPPGAAGVIFTSTDMASRNCDSHPLTV